MDSESTEMPTAIAPIIPETTAAVQPVKGKETAPRPASEHISNGVDRFVTYNVADNYHNTILQKIEGNTIIEPKFHDIASMIYGAGIRTGYYEIDDKGQRVFRPHIYPEFEEWCERWNYHEWLYRTALYLFKYWMVFQEFNFDKAEKGIARLDIKPSLHFRFGLTNDNMVSSKIYYNPRFGQTNYDANDTVDFRRINPWYSPTSQLNKYLGQDGGPTKAVMPFALPGLGVDRHYAIPPWHTAIHSEWVEYNGEMIGYRRAFKNNQTDIPFAWYFHDSLWPLVIPDYDKVVKNKESLKNAKAEFTNSLNEFYSKKENIGKGLNLPMVESKLRGEVLKLILREDFKTGKIENSFIADINEANEQILNAMGWDKGISSTNQKSGMANSGGSEKRVGFNVQSSKYQVFKEQILWVHRICRTVNGWGKQPINGQERVMDFQLPNVTVNVMSEGAETSTAATTSQSKTED